MGTQLSLFLDAILERNRLLSALTRLDHREAQALAEEFLERWPDSRLSWELELLHFCEQAAPELDPDQTYELWHEFAGRPGFSKIPEKIRNAARIRLFSRVLDAQRTPIWHQTTRTRQGVSLGEFLRLADRTAEAVKSFERERKEQGDEWRLGIAIGNCYSCLGEAKAAYSNYRRAFFLGLPTREYGQIENPRFRSWLEEAEGDWPFAEVLLRSEMPRMRFDVRSEFEDFCSQFPRDENKSPEWQFCRCFVISENRQYCEEEDWQQARRQMKVLQPRLHARYMSSLDQR